MSSSTMSDDPKLRGHCIVKRGCWSLPMCMRELLEFLKFDLKLGIDWNARHATTLSYTLSRG
jgi:hypothetical protein